VVARYRWRSIVLLEGANGASSIANAIVMILIPWLVLQRTGSAASAGLVVAAASLPGIVMSPLVGAAIDRFGRRLVSIVSDILSALSVAAFPLVAMVQDLTLPWLLALAVLGATFDPAGYTARKSLLPDVSAASGYPLDKLNGMHEGIFGVGWAIGPALGAVLIGVIGPVETFWVPFGLFVVAILAIVALRVGDAGQDARKESGEEAIGAWQGLMLGARVLWQDKALRAITVALMVLAAVYLPTESVVLPAYFEGRDEPTSLGIIVSVMSLGTIVGAFGYGWLSNRFTRYQLARVVLIGTAISIVPLALLPPLPIMIAAGLLLGLAWGPFSPLMNTLVQRRVPADVQGRVYGVQMSLFYAAPPVAFLITGWGVETFGVQATYLALAGVLVATSIGVLFVRSIRDIDN
jgi:MFS family permease